MSNEIIKRDVPITEILEMAKLFAESKMFDGISQIASAFVKIKAGAEIGIPAFAAMSGIHIIKGKLTIGANLMAACVKGSGKYDYKVVKLDESIASVDFLQSGKAIGNSTFTIADAKKAGTQNLDKYPKNMLFARAMSNGVKWFCPDVFTMPVYTPEELGEVAPVEDIQHEEVKPITPVKPKSKLNEKAMVDAVKRIAAGEIQLIDMIVGTFDLTDQQLSRLKEACHVIVAEQGEGATIVS